MEGKSCCRRPLSTLSPTASEQPPADPKKPKCGQCKWWDGWEVIGQCRLNPPTVSHGHTVWPRTRGTVDWCGRFEAKEEKGAQVSKKDYECVEPFGIDNGELSGLSNVECFTLGVEWQMVSEQARNREEFQIPIHSANHTRVAALLKRRGRRFSIGFMPEDKSENWMWLAVEPVENET